MEGAVLVWESVLVDELVVDREERDGWAPGPVLKLGTL